MAFIPYIWHMDKKDIIDIFINKECIPYKPIDKYSKKELIDEINKKINHINK